MGISSRDYMRRGPGEGVGPGAFRWNPHRGTWTVLALHVVLWFVFTAASSPRSAAGLARFIDAELLLRPEGLGAGALWSALTAFWFHRPGDLGSAAWNLLLLWSFGRRVEELLGRRSMITLYVVAGVVSMLAGGLQAGLAGTGPVLGPAGAVFALGAWVAWERPREPVVVLGLFPMRLAVFVGVTLGLTILFQGTWPAYATGAAGVLAGALAGSAWRALPATWRLPRRRASRPVPPRPLPRGDPSEERTVRERVDRLLAKIHDDGIEALTEEEKAFLQAASKRFR